LVSGAEVDNRNVGRSIPASESDFVLRPVMIELVPKPVVTRSGDVSCAETTSMVLRSHYGKAEVPLKKKRKENPATGNSFHSLPDVEMLAEVDVADPTSLRRGLVPLDRKQLLIPQVR